MSKTVQHSYLDSKIRKYEQIVLVLCSGVGLVSTLLNTIFAVAKTMPKQNWTRFIRATWSLVSGSGVSRAALVGNITLTLLGTLAAYGAYRRLLRIPLAEAYHDFISPLIVHGVTESNQEKATSAVSKTVDVLNRHIGFVDRKCTTAMKVLI